MDTDLWEVSEQAAHPETITAMTVGKFWGSAYYGESAKGQELYSSQAPLIATSQEVEKVTLLLNSFPAKAEASPLSEFEDLGVGTSAPVTTGGCSPRLLLSEGQTLK